MTGNIPLDITLALTILFGFWVLGYYTGKPEGYSKGHRDGIVLGCQYSADLELQLAEVTNLLHWERAKKNLAAESSVGLDPRFYRPGRVSIDPVPPPIITVTPPKPS